MKVAEMSLSTVVRYEPDAGEVVWLRGEHDRSTAAALSIVLARAIAAGDTDVVVDLSRVEFMDASTARVIAQARERLRVQSRLLFLRSPSRPAWRVVALCGLADSVVARALHPAVRGRSSWVREPGAA